MSEWHNLGKHAKKMIVSAIYSSPQLMAVIAAQLEGKNEEIDENTLIEVRIDTVRARIKQKDDESSEDGEKE